MLTPVGSGMQALAGLIMDYADPSWVWYASGIVGVIAAAAFYSLHLHESRSRSLEDVDSTRVPDVVTTNLGG
jgi:hypothetical protein